MYEDSLNNIQPHKEEATTFETSLTEEKFVSSIKSQGFSIDSSGWIEGSAGSNYIYRTSLVKETSSFNFPIMQ